MADQTLVSETHIVTEGPTDEPEYEPKSLIAQRHGFQPGNKWAIKPGEARNPLGGKAKKFNQMDVWVEMLEEFDPTDPASKPKLVEMFTEIYSVLKGTSTYRTRKGEILPCPATGRDRVEAARFIMEHSYGNAPKEIDVNQNVRIVQVSIPALTEGQKPKTTTIAINPEFDDDGFDVTGQQGK